ncbi:ABC transporter permease [Alkalicella caledoniensis]|uniref:ABC transporter permease n=1 Tax=Alkalicella caledoniensis TaxID=2731377 RepID=A0A7G9W9L5_ALKCA|nr:ABC transporter permease [Alkalicella caledoniensis]QNO15377.1 ABC transporter permease [Alkalicella caledoniensis]
MEGSIRRVKALFKKEIKDFPKNMNVSLMCLLPLVLILLFSNIQGDSPNQGMKGIDLLNTGLSTNLVVVSTFAISMLIAEEKEKNTMRTLMLSSVTPAEFLAGKAIVIFLFSIVTNTIIYFIAEIDQQYFGHYFLWSVIVTGIMMQIGGIIGLIAQNQMSTSVLGVPVIFAFMIIPMLAQANDILEKIASILPNHNLSILLENIFSGKGYTNSSYNILVILAWLILAAIAFIYTYNRKSLDK